MLIYLDEESGKEMLDILNTEDAFGALPKCLKPVILNIEEGLKQHGRAS